MFQHRELGLIQAYRLGATVVMSAVFWAYLVALDLFDPSVSQAGFSSYFEYFLAMVLAFQIAFLTSRQNDILSVSSGFPESHRLIWIPVVFAGVISFLFLVLTTGQMISRLFLWTCLPLSYFVLLFFTRYVALDILRFILRHQSQKLLLVGQPTELLYVESLLTKARLFGLEPIGMVTDADPSELPRSLPRLGSPDELEKILTEQVVENIFILGSPRDRRLLNGWMRLAEARGCRVSLVNDLDVFLQRRLSYFRCDGVDLIELREEPLQNLVNRALKRIFDIVLSLPVVLFILPPLTLAVWFLQRIQAPGPVFFRQLRSGTDNRPFAIFKFRSMYASPVDTGKQATVADSRIYPVGRILRRLSLDEFPQFFNVLLGHMSLVGPRPHMPQHDLVFEEVMSAYRVRGFVKPGITGLAQVRGFRGETATREDIVCRVECDIEYIESWSLALDIRIVAMTALHVFRPPRTAY